MKKLLLLIAIVLLLILLVACDKTTSNPNNGENDTTTPNYADNGDITPPDNQPTKYLLKTYSSTDEYGNAGTYTEINSQYIAGDVIELEATVKSGYNFVGWFVNDTCVSEDLKYTYTMRANNVNIEARYNYFTVTTSSYSNDYEKAGRYTGFKSKKISMGEQVTVEATVNAGYNFEGWFINDVCVSEELSYSFTMKDKDVDLEARWSYYTVSVNSYTDEQSVAGTFTKKTDEKISIGETVTLSATVNKGFNFEGWYVNGNHVSSDFEYSFIMKDEDVEVEAVYSYYFITVESWSDEQGTAGTYPKKDNERISAGETVTLTATVADGYNFEGWYIDGICVCSDLTYQFVMEKANKIISAEYSYYTFSSYGIVAKSGWLYDTPIESIIGNCTSYDCIKITDGNRIELKATVCNGYTFEGWYLGDICVSTDYEYTYTMTKNNADLVARYTYYTLNVYVTESDSGLMDYTNDRGNVTCYDNEKIQVGETITLTATAKSGYRFIGWTHGHGGVTVSTNSTYTFIMSATDDCYVAVFEKT